MKTSDRFILVPVYISLILGCAIIIAGCTSTPSPAPVSQVQTTQLQTTTQAPAAPVAASTKMPTTTVSLSHGITITVPSDWEKETLSETSLRDYGRVTTNIANFFSPDITPERIKSAGPNVDKSPYTTLSIDIDSGSVSDFEQYFNLAVIALQDHYGHIDITKHNYQLKISGYKAYQMDFDTPTNIRGSYIFTNVDGTIYIIAFKNPSPYSAEIEEIYKSIRIISQVTTQKHR